MQIQLTNAGKRFNRDWIFRKLNYTFNTAESYAITGSNGSGKSTLLQVIAASTNPSEGTVQFTNGNEKPDTENVFKYISIAAPYLELIEEMTATEFLNFHSSFKPFITSVTVKEILAIISLDTAAEKQIRYYSSGMKQRIKLAQAIFSDTPVLLLDEPCTNLDTKGYELYHLLIKKYCSNKTVIVSSNDEQEIDFCKHRISMMDWK